MRSCGSLCDTGSREVEGARLAFLRAKDLGTLEVGTTSIEIVSAFEVEEDLLWDSWVTNTLSTTLSAAKLELFFARAIAPNLEKGLNIVIDSGKVESSTLVAGCLKPLVMNGLYEVAIGHLCEFRCDHDFLPQNEW